MKKNSRKLAFVLLLFFIAGTMAVFAQDGRVRAANDQLQIAERDSERAAQLARKDYAANEAEIKRLVRNAIAAVVEAERILQNANLTASSSQNERMGRINANVQAVRNIQMLY